MRLYLSKVKDKMNGKILETEIIHDYLCLNPKYKSVSLQNPNTKVLLDSGAFQDRQNNKRVEPKDALQRQLDMENKVGFVSEKIVSYDFIGGVEETIKGNEFLASKREELKPRQLVLVIQGNTVEEFLYCLTETLKFAQAEDCIGFGGVATAGRNKTIKERLITNFRNSLPLLKQKGIKDIHLFGVGTFKVLKELKNDEFNISCDTSSYEVRSVMGNVIDLDLEKWDKVFGKEDKLVNYHPCDLTHENMKKAIKIIGGY